MPVALTTFFVSALAATSAPAATTSSPVCPAPAQLAAALNALVPGLAPTAAPLSLASGQRLDVTSSSEGDVRVDLVEAQGDVVLHRVLPAPPRGHAPDCPALAETIALIVDRYLHDVGYEAPPLPPPALQETAAPPPMTTPVAIRTDAAPVAVGAARARWRLGFAGSARRGDAGGFDGDGDLVLDVAGAGEGRRPGARLAVGYAPPAMAHFADKTATLRRLPVRLGGYLAIPAGPGQLEPGVGLGADFFFVSVSGPGSSGGTHTALSGDVALAYSAPLTGPLYIRVLSRVALAVPYIFKALEVSQVWGTPRVYGEVGVELGLAFR